MKVKMNKEHIFFTTIREDFNEYAVENGQILRMKTVLTDIIVETKEDGTKSTDVGLKDFSIVFANKKIDTSSLEYSSPDKVTDQDIIKSLEFESIKETVNIYETNQMLLLVYPRVKNVSLTNKKSGEGEPILRFTSFITFNLITKDSLMPASQPVSKG